MNNRNYKLTRDCFFRCYKSFIDYLSIVDDKNTMYSILVLKKEMYNNETKVTVIIKSHYFNNDTSNEFYNNVILTNDEATSLISDIREDFKENHYIAYCGINNQALIQTLQNTRYTMNIKLYNKDEYNKAIIFNNKINCDRTRHRVLIKN